MHRLSRKFLLILTNRHLRHCEYILETKRAAWGAAENSFGSEASVEVHEIHVPSAAGSGPASPCGPLRLRGTKRHRACTPLANFLSEDLAFTRKVKVNTTFLVRERHGRLS